jgi:hypothetical protein
MITLSSSTAEIIPLRPSAAPRWTHKGIVDWLASKSACLTAGQFQVLFALARYANKDTGEAYPSMDTIAADSGTSKGHVHKLINELLEARCIRKEGGGQGAGNVTHYWLVSDPADVERFQRDQKQQREQRRAHPYANGRDVSRQQRLARQASEDWAERDRLRREERSGAFKKHCERQEQADRAKAFRRRTNDLDPTVADDKRSSLE